MVVFLVTCKHLVIAVVVVVLDSIWTIYCMVVVDIAVVVVLEGVVMVLVVVVVGRCVDFSARSCCHGGCLDCQHCRVRKSWRGVLADF